MSEYQNLCPGCFKDKSADAVCPSCGCDEKAERDMLCLPLRTLLHQQYLIGRVLGDGGFGITYLAWDTSLETRVAIKEYMPDGLAGRGSGGLNVRPRSSKHTDGFAYGRDRFIEEARILAKFDHANIMRVRTFFKENGTGYLVMDYYDGVSLAEYLEKHDGKIPEKDALEIMTPIMDGLREVHSKKFLHRDIKPQNIYLTAGNRPVLLDFGSARMDAGERSKNLTIILSPGFAPDEQYHRKGNQGPWTDIYACAAVLYKMVTKTTPPDAPERNKKDELVPPEQLVPEISPGFNRAILKALAVEPEDRPQSIEKFQKILAPGYTGTELMESNPEEFNYVDCPHCNAKNKIPGDKPLKEAKCIKCKKILEKLKTPLPKTILEKPGPEADAEPGPVTEEPKPKAFIYVSCWHCNARNKIPEGKPLNEVKCVACKRILEKPKTEVDIESRSVHEESKQAEFNYGPGIWGVAAILALLSWCYNSYENPNPKQDKQEYTKKPRVSLRSSHHTLGADEVKSMLKRYNFFDSSWNKKGEFQNDYEQKSINGDKVVIDRATGLMWHQNGSSASMKWNEAKDWVKELNRRGYAGYRDWRLPTVEEAASLLESSEKNGDLLYIDPLFSDEQSMIWTGDKDGSEDAWDVSFLLGRVSSISLSSNYVTMCSLVRPVRSGK